jgi:hypothetical protein
MSVSLTMGGSTLTAWFQAFFEFVPFCFGFDRLALLVCAVTGAVGPQEPLRKEAL